MFFAGGLQAILDSGGCCPCRPLFLQVAVWCEYAPSDTHHNEGINNMIIQAQALAPVMKEPLLSSRVTGRLALLPEGLDHCKV